MAGKVRIDRRVHKTKKAIHTALIRLLSRKSLNTITITELAREADINRKTFYTYYSDVFAVLDEIENELVDHFSEMLRTLDLSEMERDPSRIFQSIAELVSVDLDYYGTILMLDPEVSLSLKFVDALKQRVKEVLTGHVSTDPQLLGYIIEYAVNGVAGVYHKWFADGRKIPLEDLSRSVSLMIFQGVTGLLAQT